MKMLVLIACGFVLTVGVYTKVAGEPPAADPLAWETIDRKPGGNGPLESDFKERDAANEQFKALVDNESLTVAEMPAYWSLMRWSRAQSFGELQQRARRGGVGLFKDLAEKPEKHRGELIQLELHVVRALTFKADENPAGVKRVHEAWGVTDDDTRSNPYVVIFNDTPPQLPLGASIDEEGTFVGYFLKNLGYEAHSVHRSAPLLIGRFRWRAKE